MSPTYTGPLSDKPGAAPGFFPTVRDMYTPRAFLSVSADQLIFTGPTRLGWIYIEAIAATVVIHIHDGIDNSGPEILTIDENQPRGVIRLDINMETGIYMDLNPAGAVQLGFAYVGAPGS